MRSTAWHQLARVRARIDDAARAAGRDPADVRLLAVTKSEDAAAVLDLFEAGQRDFGESRPQELEQKRAALRESVGDAARAARWHLVGHLQTNKARRTLAHLDVLHSLDRAALIEPLIEAGAARAEAPLEVFVQVKLADEANKGGFAADEVAGVLERLADRPGLRVVGLMTLAPWIEPEAERRRAAARVFLRLAQLGRDLGPGAFHRVSSSNTAQFTPQFTVQLSMGMSGDLEEAIAAGSTWVRVGSALFEGASGAEH